MTLHLLLKCIRQKEEITYLHYIKDVVQNSKDIVYYCSVDPIFKYIYLSPSIEKILGQNLVERNMNNPYTLFEICHLDDYSILEKKFSGQIDYNKPMVIRLKNEQGEYLWFEDFSTPIYKNGKLVALQGIIRNIDERIAVTKKLEYKAFHDALTNTFNREYFEQLMEHYNKRKNVLIGIVVCDLDRLKYTNDKYGHSVGDKLIKEVANLLLHCSNDKNVIATRIGGDEFAVFFINKQQYEVEHYIKKIESEIKRYNEQKNQIPIDLSIGYSYRKTSIGNMEQILIEADENMYKQKNTKKLLRNYNSMNLLKKE